MRKLIASKTLLLLSFLVLIGFSSCDILFAPKNGGGSTSTKSNFSQKGIASYYADKYEGRPTASGEKFRQNLLTAAHRTLPFGTIVTVTNLKNGRKIKVRVNDRGPFVKGRVIDLTTRGAKELDFLRAGLTDVKIEAYVEK